MIDSILGNRKPNGGVKGLSNELMQVHKICQHLFLFDSIEDRIFPSATINDNIWRCAGKFKLLICILPKMFMTGHRVSCFRFYEGEENQSGVFSPSIRCSSSSK